MKNPTTSNGFAKRSATKLSPFAASAPSAKIISAGMNALNGPMPELRSWLAGCAGKSMLAALTVVYSGEVTRRAAAALLYFWQKDEETLDYALQAQIRKVSELGEPGQAIAEDLTMLVYTLRDNSNRQGNFT